VKLLAIAAGRKNGNTEFLVKEALMAAQELGSQVRMVNLNDFKIKNCIGCWVCQDRAMRREKYECIYKDHDDMDRIMQTFLRADGIILAAPTFMLQPPAVYTAFMNRLQAYYSTLLYRAKMIDKIPDKVGGLIAVGNSTLNWMPMTLPSLYSTMSSQNIKVIDQIMADGCLGSGQVLLNETAMLKARTMGMRLAEAMQKPWDEVGWMGDEEGWCPNCHSNLLLKGKKRWNGLYYPIECAVCGAGGNLELKNGKPIFIIDPESLPENRLAATGIKEHYKEVLQNTDIFSANKEKIKALALKYRDYKIAGL
jgi:multimeric flavodoxin WrbA